MVPVTDKFKTRFNYIDYTSITFGYLKVILACLAATILITPLWKTYDIILHTILELVCILISASTFMIIWNTYCRHKKFIILGYGFLYITIFNTFHTFYYSDIGTVFGGYTGLTHKYWIVGRFCEGVVLLLCSLKISRITHNKWIGVVVTVLSAVAAGGVMLQFPGSFPMMYDGLNITILKIFFEYIVICIFVISLYLLRNDVNSKDILSYGYIFKALIIAILSGLCFTLYRNNHFYFNILGHALKIVYYLYLYKGIFQSLIIYPYEVLDDNKKHLSDILDNLPVGVIMYNNKGILSFMNDKCEELFQINADDYVGDSFDTFVYRLGLPDSDSCCQKLLNNNVINEVKEFAIKGRTVKLNVEGHRLNDSVILLMSDAAKEQELENLQLQTKTILNSISNFVIMVNVKGEIILCNNEAGKLIGSNESFLGMNIAELAEMLQVNLNDELKENILNSKQYEEVNIVNLMGMNKTLELCVSPIQNIDDVTIGYIIIGDDVTEAKIQQEKAIQQEKLALVGQLGASIVHETKNYLSVIKGVSQILGVYAKDDKIKVYSDKINKATDEVNRIISDILTLGKPKKFEMTKTPLNDLVSTMKGILETSTLMKGINFNISLCDDDMYVMCDHGQMTMVVLNIAKNAAEAMESIQNPLLTISTGIEPEKQQAYIKITDNGKGIPENIISKIGTPFFTTKERGTGLGLSLCYQVIKEHGGRIDICSKVGAGTSFKILLPRVLSVAD